ncbi:hypothetical protein OHS33_15410 [Streptomyces sp. NBC_00536]|uniref:hypothetical protein n=1 Tax=Streptomyces sp. NBC_00536 TaxID=2975769 RepID=UPI002E803126|nr:hypothetical protein [Streptomyces sp. NBC_00536]WUC79592.1 hypothetical protein OHS33_15410 [Streptomyces sp. NBC_00536]
MKNHTKLAHLIVALAAVVAVGTALSVDEHTTAPASQVLAGDAGWQSPAPVIGMASASDAGWQ